ncbi:MAG: alpha-E domain-containing protein [Pirellulaceae bacterium]
MLSRVAESIYWMARYVERAENLARFIDVTLNLMLDQPFGGDRQWEPLVFATGDEKFFNEHYGHADQETVIRFLTFDRDYPNSIVSALYAARENARSIRETISSEMWEQLNEFYHFVGDAANSDRPLESPSEFFRQVKQASHLFNGITDATLSHGTGWNFMNVGRLLERADKTSRILDVKYFTLLPNVNDVNTSIDDLQWSAVLRSVSGLEMYRKRFHGITVHRLVEFLVLDRTFPRAVQHCVWHADASLHEISGSAVGSFRNPAEQRMGQLKSELAYLRVDEIIDQGLHQFIDSLQTKLNSVGAAIHDTFFGLRPIESHTTQSQVQS